jgi:alpha-beta hydrolase superfamily lysophospholipase
MKQERFLPSKDNTTQLHVITWIPEGQPIAILQICHGMVEYIDRYHKFASFLCEQGIYVVGHDHLGHGKSVTNSDALGFFQEKTGNLTLLQDIHTIRKETSALYPDIPYFLMGHSMGSSLVRQYIGRYGAGLSGVILMGVVAEQPAPLIRFGRILCHALAKIRGWNYRSKLVDSMVTGKFGRSIQNAKTSADWISTDSEEVWRYVNDPLCSFTFTINAYDQMFAGVLDMQTQANINRIPKTLPIFLCAGSEDPVGDFGAGVRKISRKYTDAGILDVSYTLYPGARHEILNDVCRKEVYADIFHWIKKHLS